VKLPKMPRHQQATWTAEQARQFLAAAAGDRLHAAWLLALCGLRRSEICGLKWGAVNLADGTLTIAHTRVVVDGKVVVKDTPKSEMGARTLPLFAAVTAALYNLQAQQIAEADTAGEAYQASGYVVTDELGAPPNPEWVSDEWERLAARAGLPRLTIHGARHSASSLLASAGVADHIRAAWCGHTAAVNVATYTHASAEDLAAASDTLSRLYGG
jgi:integrase